MPPESVSDGCRLITDVLAVPPRVRAERVRVDRRPVGLRVLDVVRHRTGGRIEPREMANAFRDLVIGTRRVAADAEPSRDVTVLVERYAAAERDGAAADLRIALRVETFGVERLRLRHAPQRVARLRQRVQS